MYACSTNNTDQVYSVHPCLWAGGVLCIEHLHDHEQSPTTLTLINQVLNLIQKFEPKEAKINITKNTLIWPTSTCTAFCNNTFLINQL